MCGRYASSASTADLVVEFDVDETIGDDIVPSWNIAPTDPVRAVIDRRSRRAGVTAPETRQLRTLRWGLVPGWAKDRRGGAKMINARAETVTTKPAFKAAAARRRCLLPALGYYEWRKTDQGTVPYFLHDPDGRILAFAGLYEIWPDPAVPDEDPDRLLWTCTIITRPAADLLSHIHDRSPVVVPAELRDDWLDCSPGDVATARHLLDQIPETRLEPHIVSTAVGNVGNNGPELIEPIPAADFPRQERFEV